MVPSATTPSPSSSSNNNNNPNSQQLKQVITKSYLSLLQNNLNLKQAFPPGPERNRLLTVLTPAATNGTIVGIFQFFLLRRLPVLWMNRTLQQKYPKGVPKDYNWTINPQIVRPTKANDPPTFRPKFHAVTTPLSILFDVTLSTLTASAVALGTVDQSKFLKIASSLPLQGGVSPVSHALCADFVNMQKQLHDTHHAISKKYWNENQDDEVLKSIHAFVQNCKKRRVYEERLRNEYILDVGEEVVLPEEGVPNDVMIDDEEEEEEEMVFQM